MSIVNVGKKVGKWIVRPSIFNFTPGASNPFYDAMKLVKDAKNIRDSDTVDSLSRASIAKLNHAKFVKNILLIPEADRHEAGLVQHALSFLIVILWVGGVAISYTPLIMGIQLSSPVLNYIVTNLTFSFHCAAVVFSFVMFYSFITYRWRAKLYRDPLNSCDFITFMSQPSKWY